MTELLNARDILSKHIKKNLGGISQKMRLLSEDTIELDAIREAQQNAIEVALEMAAEKAEMKWVTYGEERSDRYEINSKTILNCKENLFKLIK